jgi:hypothetical protein
VEISEGNRVSPRHCYVLGEFDGHLDAPLQLNAFYSRIETVAAVAIGTNGMGL